MDALSIGEVAKQAGVRPSTLRYYESIGLLPAPVRANGRRRYDAGVLQRLAIIQTAQRAGFTLAELRLLFDQIMPCAAPESWHALVQRKLDELNALLLNVQSMKALLEDIDHCEGASLADCIYETGQRYRAG